jgi:hypothetical protein
MKLFLFVGGAVITAALGWAANYYLPKLFANSSPPPPIVAEISDNPSLIDTFSAAPETIYLPIGVRGHRVSNPPFSFCDQFRVWAAHLGGVDAGKTEFRVIVQGNSAQPVVLDGMSARVIRRVPEPRSIPVGCTTAGNATVRSIEINLDARPPLANYKTVYGTKPFAFTLNKGDTEIFDITAVSKLSNEITFWGLVLHAVIDGHGRTYVIEDRGHPFETAGWRAGIAAKIYSWGPPWAPHSPFH